MSKTRLDCIAMAHRRIGVLSADEAPSADMESYAGDTLDALFDELKEVEKMSITWALSAVPSQAFLPLSYLLAVEIAPHYQVASEPRARAMHRMRAYAFPNDVEDSRDLDDDGTVSTDEVEEGKKALFF